MYRSCVFGVVRAGKYITRFEKTKTKQNEKYDEKYVVK